ncbi:hypothetical protein BV898_15443 [Hypsibius exemplaris]|uniref:Apple domain-containing protein n=1 Tax=Hypsibius exemplaris TaxID=2072580 RepID=A0A9X6NAX6_HYPEX|nr:hypothetical protein BV898_15443 [Hypsibius exemplaris]
MSPLISVINWNDNWANGCVFPGNSNNKIVDLQMEGPSCGPKCQEILECTHFEFNPTNKMCRLKRGRMTQSQAVRHGNMICGVRKGAEAVDWSNGNWAENCDFPQSQEISRHDIHPTQCGGKCQEDDNCTHYAFNQNDGKCRLKSGVADKKKRQYLADSKRVCGLRY